ncbi:MAG: DegV family protein [Lachnospirales bacterium]
MLKYEIFSDSSCDLPQAYVAENKINIVPFSITFDEKSYLREHEDISVEDFYINLVNEKAVAKTSLPSIQAYVDAFTPFLKEGKDILCFCISSKFSGSFQSAMNAKSFLDEEYPSREIVIIDSRNATGGQGVVVKEGVKQRDSDVPILTAKQNLNRFVKGVEIYFTVDTLEYLAKGGRIGKASALVGSVLDIKPILFLKDGELGPHSKVRRRKKAMATLHDVIKGKTDELSGDYSLSFISSTFDEESQAFKQKLEEDYSIDNIDTYKIGVTIGVHTGPSALGVVIAKHI